MKRILVIINILLLFIVHGSRGQSQLPVPGDTAKVGHLLQLSDQYIKRSPDSAMIFASQAYDLSVKARYKQGIARSLLRKGIVKNTLGEYEDAVNLLLECIKIARETGDKYTEGKAYNNLGNCYALQYYYPKALENFNLALKLFKEHGDQGAVAITLNNIGNIYYYLDTDSGQTDFTEAMSYYNEALATHEARHDTDGIITTLGNIGLVYTEQQKFTEALSVLQRTLQLAQQRGNKIDVLHAYSNLGKVYHTMKNYPMALYYHNISLSLARELRNRDMIMYSYGFLAETYASMGNYAYAYQYEKQYTDMKDSLLSLETSSEIAELQSKYENEKRENEMALLKKEGELLKKERSISELKANRNLTISIASIAGLVLVLIVALLIYNRYKLKQKANELLEAQNTIIAQKNKDITDSINYAKRLQRSVIASDSYLKQFLPEHFVLYRPKDIVSGDFYWAFSPSANEVIMATADCTGHGVPGAFMSVLGASLLNEIIIEKKVHHPNLALNLLRDNIIKVLNPEGSAEETRDGMDIALCRYNFEKMTLSFSAANSVLWIARGSDMLELQGDKFPVGKHSGVLKPFAMKSVQLQKGDVIYTFTDGYADQFGGPKGKKFKYRELQQVLLAIKDKPLQEQRAALDLAFESWKGKLEQVDDVTVIGIRI